MERLTRGIQSFLRISPEVEKSKVSSSKIPETERLSNSIQAVSKERLSVSREGSDSKTYTPMLSARSIALLAGTSIVEARGPPPPARNSSSTLRGPPPPARHTQPPPSPRGPPPSPRGPPPSPRGPPPPARYTQPSPGGPPESLAAKLAANFEPRSSFSDTDRLDQAAKESEKTWRKGKIAETEEQEKIAEAAKRRASGTDAKEAAETADIRKKAKAGERMGAELARIEAESKRIDAERALASLNKSIIPPPASTTTKKT